MLHEVSDDRRRHRLEFFVASPLLGVQVPLTVDDPPEVPCQHPKSLPIRMRDPQRPTGGGVCRLSVHQLLPCESVSSLAVCRIRPPKRPTPIGMCSQNNFE